MRQDILVASVTSRFGQTDDRSKALVRAIRATPPPPGFHMLVAGGTAGVIDYADRLYEQFPRAALLIVVAIYLILLRAFASVVIPLKAVVMNVLSILASYGALVVIFQEGAFAEWHSLGFVEASLPILSFASTRAVDGLRGFLLCASTRRTCSARQHDRGHARARKIGSNHHQRRRHRGPGQSVVRGGRHCADQSPRPGHRDRRVAGCDAGARAAGAGDDATARRMELVGAGVVEAVAEVGESACLTLVVSVPFAAS